MPQKKMAFVTGGTGFIGFNLIQELSRGGWDVVALHRQTSRLDHLKPYSVLCVEGTIVDADAVARAIPEGCDAVFHVAGDVSQWSGHRERQWRTNVDGTRNVVSAALAKGVRKFVHTSSIGVYGIQTEPFDETAPKLGRDSFNYQRSKFAAEEEVIRGIDQGLDAVVMNPANVIGPYDWGTWSQFIKLAANRKLFRIPPGSACYCYVEAVVRAHVAAVGSGRTGENYILGGEAASYADIVKVIGRLLGCPVNSMVGRPVALRVAGRVSEWLSRLTGTEPMVSPESAAMVCADIICRSDKAMSELGYAPVPIDTMFTRCLEWMIAEKMLTAAAGSPLGAKSGTA